MIVNPRYEVNRVEDPIFHREAFQLLDRSIGSSALVVPGLGNNLMSFVASLPGGRNVEVILGAPPRTLPVDAWRWGNPILFPFPNRVRHARYSFDGRHYQLDQNMPEGHHLHGLVCYLPWQVDIAAPDDHGARIRCSIKGENHRDVLRQYPFPFHLTVAYVLSGNKLLCDIEVRNVGRGPMPMGFGLHPYIKIPLGSEGRREECLISLPANRMWLLDADKLPTGRQEPVPDAYDFRKPRPLGNTFLDHSYTNLVREDELAVCRLIDPRANVEVREEFGPEFPEMVVLAPVDRSTVSFEPYTCVTDAINLAASRTDTGLVALQAAETWRGRVQLSVLSISKGH